MKIKDGLKIVAEIIYKATKDRIKRLISIHASQIMIDGLNDRIGIGITKFSENYVNSINIKKCPSGILDFEVISKETKTGRGGRKYKHFVTDNGEYNFFPNAQYGAILLPSEK